ncbi:MAG: (2Fe-2S)-binding protein [Anaerovoracaceae bacterium]
MKERLQQVMSMVVNGKTYELSVGKGVHDVSPSETLAHTLRDRLGLTGAKIGCGQGACGCCTVIMEGKAITSCVTLTLDCEGKRITTIEGLADEATGELSGLQQAFVDNCGFQCGFCTSGIIMTAEALLEKNAKPTEEEVREALSGNYCRCGTHYTAVESVMAYVNREGADEE